MPATKTRKKTRKQKTPQEPVFPDRNSFEFFLEEVEYAAGGARVKPENMPLILKFLKKKFGQGLPEEEEWVPRAAR